MLMRPDGTDSAPYFAAFVASSWNIMPTGTARLDRNRQFTGDRSRHVAQPPGLSARPVFVTTAPAGEAAGFGPHGAASQPRR
jgi:hypothetical protein